MKKFIVTIALVVMALLFAGCTDPNIAAPPQPTTPVPPITVSATGFSVATYATYPSLVLHNLTASQDVTVDYDFSCWDTSMSSLTTDYSGTMTLTTKVWASVSIPYTSGYPEFVTSSVTCSAWVSNHDSNGPRVDWKWQ